MKQRDRTMIRAACYYQINLVEAFFLSLENIEDCFSVCLKLSVRGRFFLER